MDPLSPPALALGAVGLTFQVFHGLKIGYGYFDAARSMDEKCHQLKIRMRMQHVKLLQWGEDTGITTKEGRDRYEERMKSHRAVVYAILCEIQSIQKDLGKYALEGYKQLQWDGLDELLPSDDSAIVVADGDAEQHRDISTPVTGKATVAAANTSDDGRHVSIDLARFTSTFDSQFVPSKKQGAGRIVASITRISAGVKKIIKKPESLLWAIRDAARVQEYFRRLTELTDYLSESHMDNRQSAILSVTMDTHQLVLQLSRSWEEMRAFQDLQMDKSEANSVWSQATTLVNTAAGPSLKNDEKEMSSLYARIAQFKIVAGAMAPGRENQLPQALDIPETDLKIDTTGPEATMSSGTFKEEPIWIEWKPYTQVPFVLDHGRHEMRPSDKTVDGVRRLVSLLQLDFKPVEFKVPLCLGYFFSKESENPRIGIIYKSVSSANSIPEPQTLLQLLSEKTPSLKFRVRFAAEFALSLMYLHSVDWLHKGIRSASIIFHRPLEGVPLQASDFSIGGLEFARPVASGTSSVPPDDREWGLYRHPDYLGFQKAGFRMSFDIYSFGIVLLEVAYWQPIDEILGFTRLVDKKRVYTEPSPDEMKDIRNRLLRTEPKLLDGVQHAMGERYHDAVRRCIIGMDAFGLPEDAPQSNQAIAALLQQAFGRLVVDILDSIAI